MRRALLVGVVLLAAPFLFSAHAQSWPSGDAWMDGWKTDFHDPTTNIYRKTFGSGATRGAAQAYSTGSTATTASRAISLGKRFLRSPTAKLGGAALITAALFWFYDEAQKATGTGLDDWQTMDPVGTSIIETWAALDFCNTSYCDWNGSYRKRAWTGSEWTDNSVSGSANVILPAGCNTVACAIPHIESWAQGQATEAHYQQGNWKDCWNGSGSDCTWVSNTFYDPQYNRVARQKTVDARPILIDFLDTDPAAEEALENQVIKDYLQDKLDDQLGEPYTYQQPFGPDAGIELDSAPENLNVWTDNPYADSNLDTDGDGFTDAKEATAGTDPDDASSKPTVDPHDPNDPDIDGDGIPDQQDPCPYQATNECADAQPEEPMECGSIACEQTQLSMLTELEELNSGSFASPTGSPDAADTTQLEAFTPTFDGTEYDSLSSGIGARFQPVYDAASTKFPFGLSGWLPVAPTAAAGTCEPWEITFQETTADLSFCGSEADNFLRTTGRTLATGFLYLGFTMFVIGLAVRS